MKSKKNMTAEEKAEKKELIDLIDAGIPEISEERKKELEDAAIKTIARTRPISIRIQAKDLSAIQEKAQEIGVPYQTLINLLIRQYLQGKIQLTL